MKRTAEAPAHPLVRLAGWVRLGLLKELPGPAKDALMVMATYASKEDARAFTAVSTIARLTGRGRTRIFEALKLLQAGEIIAMVGRVKRRSSEAWGPTMYAICKPPSPEKFEVLVRRLRTVRWPKGVPQRRTSTSTRDPEGCFLGASRPPAEDGQPSPDGGCPPSPNGEHPRPPTEDKDRVLDREVLEGEEKREGEGEEVQEKREPRTRPSASPRGVGDNHGPREEPGGGREASKEKARAAEEETLDRLVAHFMALGGPPTPHHVDHLVRHGYERELVREALARVNGGGRGGTA